MKKFLKCKHTETKWFNFVRSCMNTNIISAWRNMRESKTYILSYFNFHRSGKIISKKFQLKFHLWKFIVMIDFFFTLNIMLYQFWFVSLNMRNIKETRLDAQQIPCHIYLKNLNARHLISFTLKELEIFLSRHYGHPVVDFIISKNPYI